MIPWQRPGLACKPLILKEEATITAMSPEPLAYSNDRHSLVVQALCGDLLARGVSLDIHAADEMLGFFLHSQGRDFEQAVVMYLESGRRIWETERQVLVWWF